MQRKVGTIPGAGAVALAVMLSAACSSRGPRVVEDRPPLVVPPVPTRTIEPPAVAEPEPVEPPADPPPAPVPQLSKPKPPTREAKPEPAKPEVPAEAGTATVNPPPPVAPLRTPTSPVGPEAARQIREILIRAQSILNNVDYQKLTADRRGAYDLAKSAITSAEEALKKEDLLLARSFAERAEFIAKQLEGR
jgi:outer membrane biosynthesis protein TonB